MSKYIDADETLEQIRKKLGVKSLSYLLEVERQIVAVIQSMSSIDIPQWIPCSERLPEEEGEYFVTVKKTAFDTEYDATEVAYCSPNHKWFNVSNCKVIAWMPLPNPYGEREGE